MVDLVNGGSSGYETGSTFSAKSTNIASYRAIQAGWNEMTTRLDLMDASNKGIQVSPGMSIVDTKAFMQPVAQHSISFDRLQVRGILA